MSRGARALVCRLHTRMVHGSRRLRLFRVLNRQAASGRSLVTAESFVCAFVVAFPGSLRQALQRKISTQALFCRCRRGTALWGRRDGGADLAGVSELRMAKEKHVMETTATENKLVEERMAVDFAPLVEAERKPTKRRASGWFGG